MQHKMNRANFTDLGLDSVKVANAIRYSANKIGRKINMTQINKLLYIAYGILLVERKERLTSESPSAWPYGPVFPRVHKHVKLYDDITDTAYKEIKAKKPEITEVIDNVVRTFSHHSAEHLSAWSHKKNSPWYIAVMESKGKWNTKIKDENIYNYFYSFLGGN